MQGMRREGFDRCGFYLHASWSYAYPFAVRSWKFEDYRGMFALLEALGLDQVMIWPMTEIAPAPLSDEDRGRFMDFCKVIKEAQAHGLGCWLVFCPCLSTDEAIRSYPFSERAFYPHRKIFRLDDPEQSAVYKAHLSELLGCLEGADGYVFIDGDPGGYPDARPDDFVALMHDVRAMLDRIAADVRPALIPWIWSGWGADWEKEGPWKPDLARLSGASLRAWKSDPPTEPWELLPGRSMREGQANGRINFECIEQAGLLDRSTLLTYEIIEYEPTPPAFILQFEDIRRVIRQEGALAPRVRGIMGNAQQPVTALHNLFCFARCVRDPLTLDQNDQETLEAFARFLGGDAEALVPAWTVAHTALDQIPQDLEERVRGTELHSEVARCIPGGSACYLNILAEFVAVRIAVLRYAALRPDSPGQAAEYLATVIAALVQWWSLHRYVCTGEQGTGFQWCHTHPVLLQPFQDGWGVSKSLHGVAFLSDTVALLIDRGLFTREEAEALFRSLEPAADLS